MPTSRFRAPSDEALEVGQGNGDPAALLELDEPRFEMRPRPEATQAGQAGPAALASGQRPVDDPDEADGNGGRVGRVGAEEQARRVGDQADLTTLVRDQQPDDRTGDRTTEGTVQDEDREGRRPVQAGLLTPLGGGEVAKVLLREAADDDPPDAHRPRPDQRLCIHPRTDDEDRAGPAHVEGRRPQLGVRTTCDLEPAACRAAGAVSARQRRAVGRQDHGHARSSLADDARGGRLEDLGQVADGDLPAPVVADGQLSGRPSVRLGVPVTGMAADRRWRGRGHLGRAGGTADRPASDRRSNQLHVPHALDQQGARRDDVAGPHEDPVADGEREADDGCLDDEGAGGYQLEAARRLGTAGTAQGPRRPIERGEDAAHRSPPAHRAPCQAASSSRRCSSRSGRRSGTSRRSINRPPRPPPTSMANRRPRVPSTTGSRNSNSAVAPCPGGRSTSWRPPGTRSSSDDPAPAWTTTRPALRPARSPWGETTLPSGARRSSARSRRSSRRSLSTGIAPSGPMSRAWSKANWHAPARRRTSASASATAGPGAGANAPPVAITRSGAGRSSRAGVAARSLASAARAAASRSAAPSPSASPQGARRRSPSRSRSRMRSSGIVAHARTPSTVASSSLAGISPPLAEIAERTTTPSFASSSLDGQAATRIPASRPTPTVSSRRSRIAARDAVVRATPASASFGRPPSLWSRSTSGSPRAGFPGAGP